MSFALETTEDVYGGDGQSLSEPGTYHFLITEMKQGEGPSGKAIDGFTVGLMVLDGTVKDQKDKTFNLCLFSPNLSHSDKGQEWARKKQTAFAIASGLIDPNNLGGRVQVELEHAVSRQVVATLSKDDKESDNGKTYLSLHFANIYHVDDPRAKSFPKDPESLSVIPADLRKGEDYFAVLQQKKGGQAKLEDKSLMDL